MLRFLGRQVGAEVAEGLAGEATDRRASARALDARLLFPRMADIEALPDGEQQPSAIPGGA